MISYLRTVDFINEKHNDSENFINCHVKKKKYLKISVIWERKRTLTTLRKFHCKNIKEVFKNIF